MVGHGLDVIKLPHAECDEVRGHLGRIEVGRLLKRPTCERPTALFRHVGEGRELHGRHERHAKDGLARRFIPAGEGASGIERFELRGCHDFFGSVYVGVGGPVESCHLIVEESVVLDGEEDGGRCGDGRCGGEEECDGGGFLVVVDFFGFDSGRGGGVLDGEGGGDEAEFLRVHDDFAAVWGQVGRCGEFDGHFSVERECRKVGSELDVIAGMGSDGMHGWVMWFGAWRFKRLDDECNTGWYVDRFLSHEITSIDHDPWQATTSCDLMWGSYRVGTMVEGRRTLPSAFLSLDVIV